LNSLEVILPLRNPPAVLEQSVKSLLAQTDRRFSVLLSDNHSTQGAELLADAEKQLTQAGLVVRRVSPPAELGRVEHWNWAHYESGAEWVKPLFAGDWLEPGYIAALHFAASACPGCRYIFSPFVLHQGEQPPKVVANPWTGRFHRAADMERIVLSYGMQFGPPSAAAYERSAFIGLGGYPTTLPICADSLLFCAMAARYGALGLPEAMCHFNIHGARFSTTLPQKRKATFQEKFTFYFMLANRAWFDGVDFPWLAFARLLAREARGYWSKG
jgi:glycosyltransferase involved in cell wall biosynthesis